MTRAAATEVASIGPVTASFGFRSWVLVDAPAGSIQRRLGSANELANVLRELGMPAEETTTVAARLWSARPPDARFSLARPWETFWSAQGLSLPMFLFWLVVFVGVFTLIGLLVWLTF